MSTNEKSSVRIELTEEQRKNLKEQTGADASAIEFDVEELEERIAPTTLGVVELEDRVAPAQLAF